MKLMEKVVFHLPGDSFSKIMEYVGQVGKKVTGEERLQGQILLEETYLRLCKGMNAPDLAATVTVKKRFGDVSVELVAHGEAVNPILSLTEWVDDEADLYNVNVLKANRERMGYARRNGANVVSIIIHEGGTKEISLTVLGLVLGLCCGALMKAVLPAETLLWVEGNINEPFEAMFMHSLTMMVAPVIFFAIIAGLTNMSETADIGKMGVHMVVQSVGLVISFSALGVGVGLLLFPGELTSLSGLFESGGGETVAGGFSLKNMLVDIIPANLVDPFKGQNLLQVLFLAIFFGVVMNRLGEKARIAREIIEFMNSFCLCVMGIVVRFVPLIVFLSMMKLAFHTGPEVLVVLGKILFGCFFFIPLCFVLFAVILAVYGKTSPTVYLRKIFAFAPVPLAINSSNAALPKTLEFANERLGISPSLASFALPVGIQLHQAGSCAYLALPAMMMARVFDKSFTVDFVLCLIVYAFIFAYTMPPVPGAGLICMGSVFSAIGVPPETVMFFLCIEPLCDMAATVVNVGCNVASSLLVAKKFDMWDDKKYMKG